MKLKCLWCDKKVSLGFVIHKKCLKEIKSEITEIKGIAQDYENAEQFKGGLHVVLNRLTELEKSLNDSF